MWTPSVIATRPVALHFESSGQGTREDLVVVADEEVIVNAVGLVDFQRNPAQVFVCAECGYTSCAPGGWVALHAFAGGVAWLPDFRGMGNPEQAAELRPPAFMVSRGVFFVPGPLLPDLVAALPAFPSLDALPPLSAADVARILQWEAPGRVLGSLSCPVSLQRASILAADDGDVSVLTAELERLLAEASALDRQATLVEHVRPVNFYLDLPGTPAWSPLGRTAAGELVLYLGAQCGVAV
jgi:hypothetical protein